MTPTDVVDSLTGWDEKAIEASAGVTLEKMQDPEKPNNVLMLRCLGAVLLWRAAQEEDKAAKYPAFYRQTMGMTQAEVNDLFAGKDDEEVFDEDPVTESGKDDSQSNDEPSAKPTSASLPESSPISTTV
ncbi:MAG TPA: hypothetical protein VIQ30_11005 [Pseudonocardia sp.]